VHEKLDSMFWLEKLPKSSSLRKCSKVGNKKELTPHPSLHFLCEVRLPWEMNKNSQIRLSDYRCLATTINQVKLSFPKNQEEWCFS